jgi:hypothetical protein
VGGRMTAGARELKLGIIGLSDGNGHPYSWAAIFNGYDRAAMASCPFPVIPAYLAERSFPADAIPGARVTHVWAQNKADAEHVARASRIPAVVERYQDMVGQVDAVLLARDDAENHLEMSRPFLEAGLPIYIDKPVALSLADLDAMYARRRRPGQIFSCSALRFAPEFQLSDAERRELGEVRHVQAVVPKSWEKYGAHVVDPVLNMFGLYGKECRVVSSFARDVRVVAADWGSLSAVFTSVGAASSDIRIRIFGTKSSRDLIFKNTYDAFKKALEVFVEGVRTGKEMTPRPELASVVSILERGIHGDR